MLIALLVVLGVNLIVAVAVGVVVVGRRHWLMKQPGAFRSAIRVTHGDMDLPSTWKRGTGRWVRDVLVWSKAPFMFRTELVPVDRLSGEREATAGEVKRLGDHPVVIEVIAGDATIEFAANAQAGPPFTGGSRSRIRTP